MDLGVFIFTLLIVVNNKDGWLAFVSNRNLFIFLTGVSAYFTFRIFGQYLSRNSVLEMVFIVLLAIEIGFLIVESFQRIVGGDLFFIPLKGTFDNSGKLGIFLAMLYPFSLVKLFSKTESRPVHKILFLTLFSLLIIFLVLSYSRSAWIAVIASTCIVIPWYLNNNRHKRVYYSIIAVIALFTIAGMFSIKQDSASGRLLIWNITIPHLRDYWMSGAGYGKFSALYNLWQADYFSAHEVMDKNFYIADNTYFAFNEFLQTAIELGWPGALLLLLLLVYILKYAVKKNLWAVACTAFLVTCLASYTFREMQHQLLFFTFLALFANNNLQGKRHLNQTPGQLKHIGIITLKFMGLLYVSAVIVFCFLQYKAIPDWKEARAELPFDERQALNLYNKAYSRLCYNPEFLLEYGVRLAETDSLYKAIQILTTSKSLFVSQIHLIELGYCYERLKDYAMAEKYYLQSINISPSKLVPRYQLLLFYDKTGKVDKAKKVAVSMQLIAPKISSDDKAKMIRELARKYL